MIQFKAKTLNNILLISTLASTLYVTSPTNVLAASLNFNKNPTVLDISLLRVRINDNNSDML